MFQKFNSVIFASTLSFITLPSVAAEQSDKHVGFNFGFGISKPILSGFYAWDRNQINLGTNFTLYTFEEGVIMAQPSITYNRTFSDNGFYGAVGLISTYIADQDHEVWEPATAPDTGWHYRNVDESDWEKLHVMAGLGKNFQWTRWGIHIDGNLITPIGKDFIDQWYYLFGAGVSYRFKLD